MPNERKQQNKSHISLAVPLTDAIQEVSPISTSRHTESRAVFHSKVSLPYVLCEALLFRENMQTTWSLTLNVLHSEDSQYYRLSKEIKKPKSPLYKTLWNTVQQQVAMKICWLVSHTKETELSVLQNEITVHNKWVKQATECACIHLFGSVAQ